MRAIETSRHWAVGRAHVGRSLVLHLCADPKHAAQREVANGVQDAQAHAADGTKQPLASAPLLTHVQGIRVCARAVDDAPPSLLLAVTRDGAPRCTPKGNRLAP